MPLGMVVSLDSSDVVLHIGTQLPATERGTAALPQFPSFRAMSIVAKWSPISATAEFLSCFSRELESGVLSAKFCGIGISTNYKSLFTELLWTFADGPTRVRMGGHHTGHRPTF